jgi:hypothetical protein
VRRFEQEARAAGAVVHPYFKFASSRLAITVPALSRSSSVRPLTR